MKKLVLFLILVLPLSCLSSTTKNLDMESFENVWRVVNEKHYDPSFSGRNWQEIHDQYRSRINGVRHGAQFRKITNEMLFELGLSHLLVLSEDDLKARLPTLFAEGEIGVDIDLIEGMPVISSVKPFSPGAHAGLHTGFIIKDIDGSSVEQLLSVGEEDLIPPFNERNRQNNITLLLLGRLYGPPETKAQFPLLPLLSTIASTSITSFGT